MLYIFNSNTQLQIWHFQLMIFQAQGDGDVCATHNSTLDEFFPPPPTSLFYIGECKCAFHYLSSYSKNVYFTLSFFSNACYYLGVHLNSHLTAYHFHMLEHILKCLLKEPVLNTNSIHPSTGLLINHHSHKKLFPLTVQQHTHRAKGKR